MIVSIRIIRMVQILDLLTPLLLVSVLVSANLRLCPDGFKRVVRKCYKNVTDVSVNYTSSKSRCKGLGGTLPLPKKPITREALKDMLRTLTDENVSFYVGLTDDIVDGTYLWGDGYHLEPADEPAVDAQEKILRDNLKASNTENKDCVQMTDEGKFLSTDCEETLSVLMCETYITEGKVCALEGKKIVLD